MVLTLNCQFYCAMIGRASESDNTQLVFTVIQVMREFLLEGGIVIIGHLKRLTVAIPVGTLYPTADFDMFHRNCDQILL